MHAQDVGGVQARVALVDLEEEVGASVSVEVRRRPEQRRRVQVQRVRVQPHRAREQPAQVARVPAPKHVQSQCKFAGVLSLICI